MILIWKILVGIGIAFLLSLIIAVIYLEYFDN